MPSTPNRARPTLAMLTVPTVPAKGDEVHACLLQLINAKWQSKDSTYFESDAPGK